MIAAAVAPAPGACSEGVRAAMNATLFPRLLEDDLEPLAVRLTGLAKALSLSFAAGESARRDATAVALRGAGLSTESAYREADHILYGGPRPRRIKAPTR